MLRALSLGWDLERSRLPGSGSGLGSNSKTLQLNRGEKIHTNQLIRLFSGGEKKNKKELWVANVSGQDCLQLELQPRPCATLPLLELCNNSVV